MTAKNIDVSALCLLSKLNIGESDSKRIEAELCEFADFAAVLDVFAAQDIEIYGADTVNLRADNPKNQASEFSDNYVTVPLTVKEAKND
ncbi:MAG: hypothetical protein E7577_02680 [Ruminococcaceae bacterium]|nr:hypothetical protein [Oscillospiraceae bacterium]